MAETDEEAEETLRQPVQPPFPMRAGVRDALLKLDSRNLAGEARAPNVGGVVPTTFVGSSDMVIAQVERCRDEAGAGVIDLMFQNPGGDPGSVIRSLELFAEKVLQRIHEV